MEKHIVDEKTGILYTLVGDYYLPLGDLPDDEPEQHPIGIWGQRHLRYIKQLRRSLYAELLMSGKLNDYLADLDGEAEKQGITEHMYHYQILVRLNRHENIRLIKQILLNQLKRPVNNYY